MSRSACPIYKRSAVKSSVETKEVLDNPQRWTNLLVDSYLVIDLLFLNANPLIIIVLPHEVVAVVLESGCNSTNCDRFLGTARLC